MMEFTSILEKPDSIGHTVIAIPDHILASKPGPRFRAQGSFNGFPFNLAVQSKAEFGKYFMVGGMLRRQAKLKENEKVLVKMEWISSEILELPEELEAILEQDSDFKQIFDTFTTGKKRSLAYYVRGVKNIDSRIKRALELAYKVKTNTLYSSDK